VAEGQGVNVNKLLTFSTVSLSPGWVWSTRH